MIILKNLFVFKKEKVNKFIKYINDDNYVLVWTTKETIFSNCWMIWNQESPKILTGEEQSKSFLFQILCISLQTKAFKIVKALKMLFTVYGRDISYYNHETSWSHITQVFPSLCLILSSCFHAVKGKRLEPTYTI